MSKSSQQVKELAHVCEDLSVRASESIMGLC